MVTDDYEGWREISISYRRADRSFDVDQEWEAIDAALAALGCACTEETPDDQPCVIGDVVAGSHPLADELRDGD